ncbi:MAG TPA: VCBS repeat-containing protein [Acidobacteriota bacterium]|nr:VCBS repeat-containing protein [Acidobacteriota bacterium]
MGLVWIAEDLDCDGEIELVAQDGDQLGIYSGPAWTLRAQFIWPGMNVVMHPTLVDLDGDRFPEICAVPHSLGGTARAVIIDYDSSTGDFVKLADIAAPNGAAGQPAVGDFDEDGRMEFIWGNNDYGYELFEWQAPSLVYIGFVGDTLDVNCFAAVACRPKPGGVLHALLGYSGTDQPWSFAYYLLEPTGDNAFTKIHVFQESTGLMGEHPCWAADVDCDGLDEMVMGFAPNFRVWEWVEEHSDFVESCTWDVYVYGSLSNWYTLDLNRDSLPEWGAVSHLRWFYAFPHPECVYCDSTGHCPVNDPCFCACPADPVCDGVTNVLDVITAVDVAFRGAQPPHDSFEQCPYALTDVTCNGFTDVLDVVHLVNVAFRSGDPAIEFCEPCVP